GALSESPGALTTTQLNRLARAVVRERAWVWASIRADGIHCSAGRHRNRSQSASFGLRIHCTQAPLLILGAHPEAAAVTVRVRSRSIRRVVEGPRNRSAQSIHLSPCRAAGRAACGC